MDKFNSINWQNVAEGLYDKGYALIPKFLPENQCQSLIENYDNPHDYRKTVAMERHRFGIGEYKYFDYPLPELVQMIREKIYPQLVPVANAWMKVLNIDKNFPETLQELNQQCAAQNQLKPTALILKYGQSGFNTLHQDLYGEVYFPMQAAVFLNEPGVDFTGGYFVLTEQVPRAQSKPIVLNPHKGDMLIFTTNFRPIRGVKGYYRAKIRHGVSELHSGKRYTLGVIFHDAIK